MENVVSILHRTETLALQWCCSRVSKTEHFYFSFDIIQAGHSCFCTEVIFFFLETRYFFMKSNLFCLNLSIPPNRQKIPTRSHQSCCWWKASSHIQCTIYLQLILTQQLLLLLAKLSFMHILWGSDVLVAQTRAGAVHPRQQLHNTQSG